MQKEQLLANFFAKICKQRKHHNVPIFIIMLDTSIHSLSSDFFYLFYIVTSNNLLHVNKLGSLCDTLSVNSGSVSASGPGLSFRADPVLKLLFVLLYQTCMDLAPGHTNGFAT